MIARAWAFIRLGRPHFLFGGFVLNAFGAALAVYAGSPFDWRIYAAGQVAITAIQWMTHYSNDYFDLAADRANPTPTDWSGGSRVLPEGQLPARVALWTAVALALVALAATLIAAFALPTGPLALPLLVLALVWAWSYSAPPLRLAARGLGELSVALLVPGLTPVVGFYQQAGYIWPPLFAFIAPLCCLQFAMSLSINFPDAQGDVAAGKRTLLLRIGPPRAAALYIGAIVAAYVLFAALAASGQPALALAGLPLGIALCWRMARGDWARPARWNALAFWSVALLVGSMTLQTMGIIAALVWR
jgi:1,4-dihydroxy-2-naphthoate octaprenyltransferase